nr:hypothetical protein Iba_chr09cCG2240 [Ipomoea batatas]GMD38380.1 hypothetical protein Iba_chr09fCG3390 [Ipomoea batatas]
MLEQGMYSRSKTSLVNALSIWRRVEPTRDQQCLELLWWQWLKSWGLKWLYDHWNIFCNMVSRILEGLFLWLWASFVYQIQRSVSRTH